MKNFTKLFFAILFAFTQSFTSQAQDLTLQGVLDLTVPGGGSAGKAVHLHALTAISDLSTYGVSLHQMGMVQKQVKNILFLQFLLQPEMIFY